MFRKSISVIVLFFFVCSFITPVHAVETPFMASLPVPGTMVLLSQAFEPALIKGMTVHQENPFLFDFIVDTGHSKLRGEELKKEGDRLIKYFFAALTIPEKDLWVNLSPYEKDRMVPQALGMTAMGRDLLAQDYMLKQLTASLIYPEKELGRNFWDKVYAEAGKRFGSTNIPVNTFNKVWIVAEKASVYEHNQTAFVVSGHLKVMLEEDYLAQNRGQRPIFSKEDHNFKNRALSPILREVVIPAIEQEINTGKNFATLRQIFYSQILATWFKRNLKEALLSKVYADKSTVKGVNLQDSSIKEQIYQRYLQAYKKGAFNYIKEDPSTGSGQGPVVRKYFSGGYAVNPAMLTIASSDEARNSARPAGDFAVLSTTVNINSVLFEFSPEDKAMTKEALQAWESGFRRDLNILKGAGLNITYPELEAHYAALKELQQTYSPDAFRGFSASGILSKWLKGNVTNIQPSVILALEAKMGRFFTNLNYTFEQKMNDLKTTGLSDEQVLGALTVYWITAISPDVAMNVPMGQLRANRDKKHILIMAPQGDTIWPSDLRRVLKGAGYERVIRFFNVTDAMKSVKEFKMASEYGINLDLIIIPQENAQTFIGQLRSLGFYQRVMVVGSADKNLELALTTDVNLVGKLVIPPQGKDFDITPVISVLESNPGMTSQESVDIVVDRFGKSNSWMRQEAVKGKLEDYFTGPTKEKLEVIYQLIQGKEKLNKESISYVLGRAIAMYELGLNEGIEGIKKTYDAAMITGDQVRDGKRAVLEFIQENADKLQFPEGIEKNLERIMISDALEDFVVNLDKNIPIKEMKMRDFPDPRWRLYVVAQKIVLRKTTVNASIVGGDEKTEGLIKKVQDNLKMLRERNWALMFEELNKKDPAMAVAGFAIPAGIRVYEFDKFVDMYVNDDPKILNNNITIILRYGAIIANLPRGALRISAAGTSTIVNPVISGSLRDYSGKTPVKKLFVIIDGVEITLTSKEVVSINEGSMDPAVISSARDGGIDLKELNKGLSVSKDANGGVVMKVDPAMLERVRREGIQSATPVIINMRMLPSVLPLLGLQPMVRRKHGSESSYS